MSTVITCEDVEELKMKVKELELRVEELESEIEELQKVVQKLQKIVNMHSTDIYQLFSAINFG